MVMVMLNQCGTLSLNVANCLYGKAYVLNRLFYSLQIVCESLEFDEFCFL